MSKSRKVAHIVNKGIFSAAYINHMKMEMPKWDHIFIISKPEEKLDIIDDERVYYINAYNSVSCIMQIMRLIKPVNKIIVSGFFESMIAVVFFSSKLLKKTYIHFWGGDFYAFEETKALSVWKHPKIFLFQELKYRVFRKCSGLIFLIDGEYEKFVSLTGIQNKHFVAPMPADPHHLVDYSQYFRRAEEKVHRILVGNSATSTNQHLEILQWLSRYKDCIVDMEVLCPLSYGDEAYRDMVVREGKRLLGHMFKPVFEYMNEEQYVQLLSTCAIGIFNNNRQQAMGNINTMLFLGKKVYMRTDTSMWSVYLNRGYIIYPLDKISEINADDFFNTTNENRVINYKMGEQYRKKQEENAIVLWGKIFDE